MDDIHNKKKLDFPVIGWMTSMRTTTKRIFFWFPATGWRTSMGTTEETKNFPAVGWMISMRTTTKRKIKFSCDRMDDI
jgi:hypothetical protein